MLYPRQLFRMYSWICHWRVSASVTDPHNRLLVLVTRCLQWSSKVLGPLWITNSGLHSKQMSPVHFTKHYKHQKWMWKWKNQHVTDIIHERGTKKKSESPTGFEPMTSQTPGGRSIHLSYATLQVKVFARSPFGNQLFWFRETFLQIKSPAAKF